MASDRAACLTVVNVQLIQDIIIVKCPGSEQTENLEDENTHYTLALVHDDRRTTVREKTEVGSLMRLSPIFGAKKWALSACQAESQ